MQAPEAKSKVSDWGIKSTLAYRVKANSGKWLPVGNVLESTMEDKVIVNSSIRSHTCFSLDSASVLRCETQGGYHCNLMYSCVWHRDGDRYRRSFLGKKKIRKAVVNE